MEQAKYPLDLHRNNCKYNDKSFGDKPELNDGHQATISSLKIYDFLKIA